MAAHNTTYYFVPGCQNAPDVENFSDCLALLTKTMGWDEDPETAAEIAYQVRLIFNYFHSKPVYSYERILGKGSYGVACLLREVRNEVLLQKFVVKRSILGHGDGSIKNEAKVLDWLAGAPHIVKKIALSKTEDIERYLSGPTLITEYLRNGTLARFILRLEDTPEKIPNRLLWRIFLCCEFGKC